MLTMLTGPGPGLWLGSGMKPHIPPLGLSQSNGKKTGGLQYLGGPGHCAKGTRHPGTQTHREVFCKFPMFLSEKHIIECVCLLSLHKPPHIACVC